MGDGTRPFISIYTLPGEPPPAGGDTTVPTSQVIPLPGQADAVEKIGGYRLLRVLGRGGMGVVHLAESVALRRQVALKVLTAAGDPEAVERFLIEARAAARLKHPNVVGVHEVARDGARWFLAMDLVEGESLRARIVRDGPLAPREAARVAAAIGDALQHAHAHGVLHRDVKPHNVMLARDGTPLLADFGLAKEMDAEGVTMTGTVMGTPAYMPPEQAMGDRARVDRRADVYSLGATLYEALTGSPPFEGPTAINVVRQVIEVAPVPPSRRRPGIGRDLETIVLKALEKEPGARYDTAADLAEDLRRWSRHEPIAARRTGLAGRLARWALRHPIATAGSALGALVAVVVLSVVAGATLARTRAGAEAGRRALEAEQRLLRADGAIETLEAIRTALGAAQAWKALAPDEPAVRTTLVRIATNAAERARSAQDSSLTYAAYLQARDHASGLPGGDLAALTSSVVWCQRLQEAQYLRTMEEDRAGAERAATAAIEVRPEWTEAWLVRAVIRYQGGRLGEALEDVDEALRREPDQWALRAVRARFRAARGDLPGAIEDQRRVVELRPADVAGLAKLAELLAASGEHEEALRCLAPAIQDDAAALPALIERARIRTELGQREAALDDIRRALRLAPDDLKALRVLGQVLFELDRGPEALPTLDRLLELDPTDAPTHWRRGVVRGRAGDHARALPDLEAAVRLAPGEVEFLRQLAQYRLKALGDPEGALADLDRALALEPSAAGLVQRAEALAVLGRLDEAVQVATTAIHLDPTYALGWAQRGALLSGSASREGRVQAASDLRRFLELAPYHEFAAGVRAKLAELAARDR